MHLACAAGDLECVRALTERITATEEVEAVNCTGVLISKKKGVDVTEEEEQVTTVNRPRAIQYADVELRNYDGKFFLSQNLRSVSSHEAREMNDRRSINANSFGVLVTLVGIFRQEWYGDHRLM